MEAIWNDRVSSEPLLRKSPKPKSRTGGDHEFATGSKYCWLVDQHGMEARRSRHICNHYRHQSLHLPGQWTTELRSGQLYVSALTAYRFFLWLRDLYSYANCPLAMCWLLLSPTDAEIATEN